MRSNALNRPSLVSTAFIAVAELKHRVWMSNITSQAAVSTAFIAVAELKREPVRQQRRNLIRVSTAFIAVAELKHTEQHVALVWA